MKFNQIKVIMLICAAIVLYVAIANYLEFQKKTAENTELLFANNEKIIAVNFHGQGKSLEVTDDEVLLFLNNAFHQGVHRAYKAGVVYDVEFFLQSGKRVKTWVYVYNTLDGLAVAIPHRTHAGDPEYWDVQFSEQLPPKAQHLLEVLTFKINPKGVTQDELDPPTIAHEIPEKFNAGQASRLTNQMKVQPTSN